MIRRRYLPGMAKGRKMQTEDGLPPERRLRAALAIFATLVMVVLDGAIANLALPTLTDVFAVPPADTVWVVSAYQMALVMCLLPSAAIGESLGYRRVFTIGVAVFTLASALCCLAPSLPWLVAARFLQGVGGSAVMGLNIALLRFSFPSAMIGRAFGWNAMVIALSSAAGPTVGAAILAHAGWTWLFAINLPVGAVVLLTSRGLPRPEGSGRKLDAISMALNALMFGPLILGVDRLGAHPAQGLALLAMAAVSLVLLIRRARPQAAPLIPLDLLRNRTFSLAITASFCCFAAQMANGVALPFYLQHDLGRGAWEAGLYMTAWPVGVGLIAPFAGRLADRLPTGLLCASGAGMLMVGLALSALWPLREGLLPLIGFTLLCGLGFGLFQTPNNRTMILAAPRERSGAAGGMQGTARLSGQTGGALIMTVLFSLTPAMGAPRIGLGIAALMALTGGVLSVLRHQNGA
jgi:MFS transporter, DHA2 family, multidrug resistance protein